MIRNVPITNSTVVNTADTEYKFGHTIYKVVTKFNFKGENLNEILARLIKKEIQKTA